MTAERPLRVTFVVPDLAAGGAERHLVTLVEHLDRRRVEPRVVCLGDRGVLFEAAARAAPAVALGHSKRNALRSVATLARELRRTRPDVVVTRGYSAEAIGRVAALVSRVPRSVVWVHNDRDLDTRGVVRRISDRLLERSTDAYFGVAEAQLPYLVDHLGHPASKVTVIRNGVDLADWSRPEDESARDEVRAGLGLGVDDVVVAILAGLRPEKDHELFLAAARRVAALDPGVRFLVVGDGELRAHLESRAAGLGIADRVVFAGYRGDVPRVLQAVDVVVLCSRTEGFPVSLLEAMAARRPVVATRVGGVPEIVQEGVTGHLVDPGDEAGLVLRLLELLEQPASRDSLGAAGRTRVERELSLEASVRATERALARVVEGC